MLTISLFYHDTLNINHIFIQKKIKFEFNSQKAIQRLQAKKDTKYPKSYLASYLDLVGQRSVCIEGCQKICSPDLTA